MLRFYSSYKKYSNFFFGVLVISIALSCTSNVLAMKGTNGKRKFDTFNDSKENVNSKKLRLIPTTFYCSDEKIKKYLRKSGLDISKQWDDIIEQNISTGESINKFFDRKNVANKEQEIFFEQVGKIATALTSFFEKEKNFIKYLSKQLYSEFKNSSFLVEVTNVHEITQPHTTHHLKVLHTSIIKAENKKSLCKALGQAIAYHFSKESLQHRISIEENTILSEPFCIVKVSVCDTSNALLQSEITLKNEFLIEEKDSIIKKYVAQALKPQSYSKSTTIGALFLSFVTLQGALWFTTTSFPSLFHDACSAPQPDGTTLCCDLTQSSIECCQYNTNSGEQGICKSIPIFDSINSDACCTATSQGDILCSIDACFNPAATKNDCKNETLSSFSKQNSSPMPQQSNILASTTSASQKSLFQIETIQNDLSQEQPQVCQTICAYLDGKPEIQPDTTCQQMCSLIDQTVEHVQNALQETKEFRAIKEPLKQQLKSILASNPQDASISCSSDVSKLGISQKIRALWHHFYRKPVICSFDNQGTYSVTCCKEKKCVHINPLDGSSPLSSCCRVQDDKIICGQELCSNQEAMRYQCTNNVQHGQQTSQIYQELTAFAEKFNSNNGVIFACINNNQTPNTYRHIQELSQKLGLSSQPVVYLSQSHAQKFTAPANSIVLNLEALKDKSDHAIQAIMMQQLTSQVSWYNHPNFDKCEKHDGTTICRTEDGGIYRLNHQTERDIRGALATNNPCLYARELTENPESTLIIEQEAINSWGGWLKNKLWDNPFYSPWKKAELIIPTISQENAPKINEREDSLESRQAILRGLDQKLHAAHSFLNVDEK